MYTFCWIIFTFQASRARANTKGTCMQTLKKVIFHLNLIIWLSTFLFNGFTGKEFHAAWLFPLNVYNIYFWDYTAFEYSVVYFIDDTRNFAEGGGRDFYNFYHYSIIFKNVSKLTKSFINLISEKQCLVVSEMHSFKNTDIKLLRCSSQPPEIFI